MSAVDESSADYNKRASYRKQSSIMRCRVGGRRGKKTNCVEVCPALSVGTLTHAFRAGVWHVGWTAAEQRPAAALQQRLKPSNQCFIIIIYRRCNMLPDQEAGEGFRPRHSALHLIPPPPPPLLLPPPPPPHFIPLSGQIAFCFLPRRCLGVILPVVLISSGEKG